MVGTNMDAANMESACNKLHAAGDDLEALQEAVEGASYLDSVPGDFRQKLRAARSRLRKLQEQRERGVAAADRSPHAKAEYNPSEFDELVKKFEQLSWRMVSRPGGAVAKPDDFYRLYGLKQQVLHGDCNEERPMWAERGGLDFEGRSRWDAWTAVKGTEPEKCKLRFVRLYYEFPPTALYKDTRGSA